MPLSDVESEESVKVEEQNLIKEDDIDPEEFARVKEERRKCILELDRWARAFENNNNRKPTNEDCDQMILADFKHYQKKYYHMKIAMIEKQHLDANLEKLAMLKSGQNQEANAGDGTVTRRATMFGMTMSGFGANEQAKRL